MEICDCCNREIVGRPIQDEVASGVFCSIECCNATIDDAITADHYSAGLNPQDEI
jgi:hypothetical protein